MKMLMLHLSSHLNIESVNISEIFEDNGRGKVQRNNAIPHFLNFEILPLES